MTKRNDQIGTCPCIAKGCDETAKVFKFQQRGTGEGTRFAGKWYAICPTGHQFGTRGDSQEWIAEKGTLWGDRKPGAAPVKAASEPVPAPEKTADASTSTQQLPPGEQAAARKRRGLGFW